jgi:phenylacetate-CoA ligase
MAGIAGRIGDAVKVRGLFIAPSQMKLLSAKFEGIPLQAVVSRKGHEDVLTLRVEKVNSQVHSDGWENNFKKMFKEICTVRIDVLEYVEKSGIKPDQKMIIDSRMW